MNPADLNAVHRDGVSLSSDFDTWWATHGIRYEAGGHEERARHAFEAGARTATPLPKGEWLDVLAPDEEKPLEVRMSVPLGMELAAPECQTLTLNRALGRMALASGEHDWVESWTGASRVCRRCRKYDRIWALPL